MMAEPIGIASGLVALATVAFKSSISLYNTVQNFQNHPRRVRDLLEELQALSEVLRLLTATASATAGVDFSALELPLRRCNDACKEFEQEIIKCSLRSGGTRTSFRDWTKLTYMGGDIDSFKLLLAGYKSTINIALADANLRKSSVTAEDLKICSDLVKTTTDDLEAHLQSIDEKLESIFARNVTEFDSDASDLRLMKEERLSTQKCLEICAQLSDHINQIQISRRSSGLIDPEPLPERFINEGLQGCQESLRITTAKLEKYMLDVLDRSIAKSKTTMASGEVADLARLRGEWEAARQCVDICSKVNKRLKADISIIENYATGDETIQFLVSTDGKIVHGKNQGFGFRNKQVGGHLSDLSLQQISRDMASGRTIDHAASSREPTPSAPGGGMEQGSSSEFRGRYGPGFTLTTKSTPDIVMSSERLSRGEASSTPKP